MKKNKKAIIEDWVPLFVSMIIMVLIILFFIGVKTSDPKEDVFLEGKNEINAHQNLNNYLREYSDLIILRAIDNSYEQEFRKKTIDYFNDIYSEKWRLVIEEFNENIKPSPLELHRKFILVYVPYFDKNIEVKFYYE